MARTRFYIQDGLIVKKYNDNDKDVPGLFDLDKWFKKELNRYHVGYFDDCCPDDAISTVRPALFNTVTGETQYWNGTEYVDTADWVAPTTTTTSTSSTTTTTTTAAPITTTTTTAAPTTTTTTTLP